MITENLSTLKIHKLTQAQYDRELEKGTLDPSAIYLTPDEGIDLSGYATEEWVEGKGYLTSYTDTNTTYTLVKEGNTIKLVGSDGSETTVTDADTDTDINTTYTLVKEGNVIKLVGSDGSETTVTDEDTNTTYGAGTGINIDSNNKIINTGVRSVSTGATNGTIKVNTNGTETEVSVAGLGSAAYTAAADYAKAADLEAVESIAKGANQAVSYADYETMVGVLNAIAADKYNIGQNIMIVALDVPDLWVSAIEATSVDYSYTGDEDFTSVLKTTGSVQVGYYKLSALETQKVDLSDYATTSYVDTAIGGITAIPDADIVALFN